MGWRRGASVRHRVDVPDVAARSEAMTCSCRKPVPPGQMPYGTRSVDQPLASAGPVLIRPEVR